MKLHVIRKVDQTGLISPYDEGGSTQADLSHEVEKWFPRISPAVVKCGKQFFVLGV